MDEDKQIQKIPKYPTEAFEEDSKSLLKRSLKDLGIISSIPIPPENLGFSGFIAQYCGYWSNDDYKIKSQQERNKIVLSVFPTRFWDDLGVSLTDVLLHADILCRGSAPLQIEIQKNENAWLVKHGTEIFHAMKKATAHGGEFNKDKDFLIKCSEIKSGELQILGLHMLLSLPSEEQKYFLENTRQSLVLENALRLWAELVCFPLAKSSKLIQKSRFSTPLFLDLMDEMGFVRAIDFIRALPEYNFLDKNNDRDPALTFENYVRQYSFLLLGIKNNN